VPSLLECLDYVQLLVGSDPSENCRLFRGFLQIGPAQLGQFFAVHRPLYLKTDFGAHLVCDKFVVSRQYLDAYAERF
jgi:hypothetical protein